MFDIFLTLDRLFLDNPLKDLQIRRLDLQNVFNLPKLIFLHFRVSEEIHFNARSFHCVSGAKSRF